MSDLKQVYYIAEQSLHRLKEVIEDNNFTSQDAIEFVESYKEDIKEMLDNKIAQLKTRR